MFVFEFYQLLALIPLPLLWLLASKRKSTQTSLTVPFFAQLEENNLLTGEQTQINKQSLLLWLAWLCLILAAMKPIWIDDGIKLPIKGRDIMLAIDLSGSMRHTDFTLNGRRVTRLAVVKNAAQKFIKARKYDRLGLVVFGSNAFLYSPLTFDKSLLLEYLNDAQINMAGQNTAIGDAILLAIEHFINNKKQSAEKRTLILLTDGENTAGSIKPNEASELASQENIKIYTIGMGKKRDFFSRGIDEATLKNIAKTTNGEYFRAANSNSLNKVYRDIDRLEQKKIENKIYRPRHDLFYYPLTAFLLTLCSLLLRKIL